MKYSIKVSLLPQKNKKGEFLKSLPIRLRVSYLCNRVELRVGYSIEPEKWNHEEERVINNTRNRFGQTSSAINKAIFSCIEELEAIFIRYEHLEKRMPTSDELKAIFAERMGRQVDKTEELNFYSVYDKFTKTIGRQNNWTKATFQKFAALKRHLLTYDPSLSFEELSQDKLQELISSMQASDLRNTTISKYISFLRWFLRWAYNAGFYEGVLHETFKPKLKGTDGNSKEIIYLEWEELLSLYSFEFPSSRPSLSAVRDVFCFCCFTGLRYSDVAKLRRSDVKDNYIRVVTQKTIDGLTIELNKYSRAILDKYNKSSSPNNLALPVISNAKMNEYLKVMGKLAGIKEPQRIVFFKGSDRYEQVLPKYALLTTHCGRRTFIINSLRLGVPAEVIMSWTGHSDYKAMKPYIKIVNALKVSEMDKFNKFPIPVIKKSDKGTRKGTQKGTRK